jgi:hypothetical protein
MTAVASTQGDGAFPFSFGALFGSGSSSKGQFLKYEPPSIGISRPSPNSPSGANQSSRAVNASPTSKLPSSQKRENPFSNPKFTALVSKFRVLVAGSASYEDIVSALSKYNISRDEFKRFPVFALDLLRRKRWDLADILKFLSDPHVHVPTIDSQDAGALVKHILEVPLTGDILKIRKHYSKFLAKALGENATVLGEEPCSTPNQVQWRAALLTFISSILTSPEADKMLALQLPLGQHYVLNRLMPTWNSNREATHHLAELIVDSGKVGKLAGPRASDVACILSGLPQATLATWIPSIVFHLQKPTPTGPKLGKRSPPAADTGGIERLLHIIRKMETEKGSKMFGSLSLHIYDILAGQILRPSDGKSLLKLEPLKLAKLLLQPLEGHVNPKMPSDKRIAGPFAEHLACLSKTSTNCGNIFEFVVGFLYEHKHADMIIKFLRNLEANEANIPNGAKFLHQFILKVIDEKNRFAFHLAHAINALKMSYDPEFPLTTVVEALETRNQFQDIIKAAAASRLLPPSLRDQPIDTLLKAQTVLIHQIAHQYSLDLSRECRDIQRQIHRLYKFLRTRNLPIGPLFTQAVVRVFIARPLAEGRWVSSRRVEGICVIVAKVEGRDVAQRVGEEFWNWRGQLMKYAQQRLWQVGGSGRPMVNDVRRMGLL